MKRLGTLGMLAAFVFPLIVAAGCESDKGIQLAYDRPPLYEVPQHVKKVAVSRFESRQTNAQWGEVASDKMVAALDAANKRFDRYTLYDRTRLKAVLGEQEVKLANAKTAQEAAALGKIADVDAVIYGSVICNVHDDQASRQVTDWSTNPPHARTVYYTKRTCDVTVSFSMIDVATTKTLAADTKSLHWDSDEAEKAKGGGAAFMKAMGAGGNESLPSPSSIFTQLIDRGVAEFVAEISPHQECVPVKLEKGGPSSVGAGNAFAAAGDYKSALASYQQGINEKPNDAGIYFNAGVACEALTDFAQAKTYYTQAIGRAGEGAPKKYTEGLNRVRKILDEAATAKNTTGGPGGIH